MASILVPPNRTVPRREDVLEGLAVRGPEQWTPLAKLANWLAARGNQPVPATRVGVTMSAGSTYSFSFFHKPTIQTIQRLWVLRSGDQKSDYSSATLTFEDSSTSEVSFVKLDEALPTKSIDAVTSQTDVLVSTPLDIDVSVNDLYLQSIACIALPRPLLEDDNTDQGTNVDGLRSGQPGIQPSFDNALDLLTVEGEVARRSCLAAWAVPHTVDSSVSTTFSSSQTGTSFADVFDIEIPILAQHRGIGDTQTTITWAALLWVSAGTSTAEARVQTTSGNTSSTQTTSNSSPTWVSGTVDVDAEDLSTSNGLRGGVYDLIQLQIRAGDGSTTCECAGFAALET